MGLSGAEVKRGPWRAWLLQVLELGKEIPEKGLTFRVHQVRRNKLWRRPLASQKSSQHARRALWCPRQGILREGSLGDERSDAADLEKGFTSLELHDRGGMVAVDFLRAEKLDRGDNITRVDARQKVLLDCPGAGDGGRA